jgi:phenylacetate-CoA ligase
MNLPLLIDILAKRRQLRQHDHWTREQLETYQAKSLQQLRTFAYAKSRFYQHFHKGLEQKPLAALPVLTKAMLMEQFDDLVTDPAIHFKDVEAHLATLKDNERFLGKYWVNATSGSTGRRGIFVYSQEEWTTILASYARVYAWGGIRAGLTRQSKIAVVSTTTPWHQSARVGATVRSPFVPTLRLDATHPLQDNIAALNAFQPEALVTYASMGRLLALAQLEGILTIAPHSVFTASEVLTEETRHLITKAWGKPPTNVYGATETATIASECEYHAGLHLFEDLVITEVVDDHYRSVPVGEYGEKILVTVLFSRTQPLIRYEMSDSVRLSNKVCPSKKPYALLDGIQGRHEEVLSLPTPSGTKVAIHPNVFHDVMDFISTGGWQVILEPTGLRLLLVGVKRRDDEVRLERALRSALTAQGANIPAITTEWVEAIPRGAVGKAPLVKSNVREG